MLVGVFAALPDQWSRFKIAKPFAEMVSQLGYRQEGPLHDR